MSDYQSLPDDLPVPHDDGAADHLSGLTMPSVRLASSGGGEVDLAALGSGRTVLYVYPMTGTPGVALPEGWDEIPGARGCTPESCAFRDHFTQLREAGADAVYGGALNLPTFVAAGVTRYRRLTLVVVDGRIEHVFYPIFPPDGHAAEVLAWLSAHAVA
jgi:peroxiredoxin